MNILGISYSIHEAAAGLLREGELVFACAEERLSRKNKDGSFPVRAIRAALDFAGLKPEEIDHVAVGWPEPFTTFKHNVKTLLKGYWPWTVQRWERVLAQYFIARRHRGGALDFRRAFGEPRTRIHFVNHHQA